jgi:hypothetical protein
MDTSRVRESEEEFEKRGVLAHVEHVKSVGEALTKAVDTFMKRQEASDATGDWRDDFVKNVTAASIDAHTFLSASSKKVFDILFGTDESTEDNKRGRSTAGPASEPRPRKSTE